MRLIVPDVNVILRPIYKQTDYEKAEELLKEAALERIHLIVPNLFLNEFKTALIPCAKGLQPLLQSSYRGSRAIELSNFCSSPSPCARQEHLEEITSIFQALGVHLVSGQA